jgi:serine/threonine-protein kinase
VIDIGTSVGNYLVKSKLGEGGMGIVFLAEHPLISRRVAIKVIHPDYARNPEAVSRFFTEAQAVNRIGHPNIVDITDFGQSAEGESYFIMEYLAGESLSGRLAKGRMPLAVGLHIAVQVADALAASHASSILHRDLKPDNVFLIIRGHDHSVVKVLDFGLAKLTGGDQKSSHKTRTGSVMGTPYYMAPEQCAGKSDIDGRADVYSLGVMLWEMVVGRVPFPGEGYGEIIVKHLTEPAPRAIAENPECPPWLDEVIDHALAKEKTQRVQTMAELRDTLQAQLDQIPPELMAAAGMAHQMGSRPPSMGSQPPRQASRPPLRPSGVTPISTLGLATGETGENSALPHGSRSRSMPLWIGAGAVVVALAVGGALALRKPSAAGPTTPTAASGTLPAPATPAAGTARPAPAPSAGVAATNLMRFESVPSGATVARDNNVVLGVTPMDWPLPHGTSAVAITFTKAGFEPQVRLVVPDRPTTLTATLAAVAQDQDRKTPSPSSSRRSRGETRPKASDTPQGDGEIMAPSF